MNTFGKIFKVTLLGASHEPFVGVKVEGVPQGIVIAPEDFAEDIARRRAGAAGTTARRETDVPEITRDGSAIIIKFRNADTRNEDYARFADVPRPGHADRCCTVKYGHNFPGGGIFSGRMTLPIVAAGVIAKKVCAKAAVKAGADSAFTLSARIESIGGSEDPAAWDNLIAAAAEAGDTLGGIVRCTATPPAGLGEPFWDGVEQMLAHAIFAIPGVRGIEFGDGFKAAAMRGSEHNDPWGPDGKPAKNGAGGINGGITSGAPLDFRVAFKPASSIAAPQTTFDFREGRMTELAVAGRHDTCFALRTPPVVEAATAIVLADLMLTYNEKQTEE